jgi:hypothetical protein
MIDLGRYMALMSQQVVVVMRSGEVTSVDWEAGSAQPYKEESLSPWLGPLFECTYAA